MRWDLYCRVIDNWGDAGVCWRLAADLGARGQTVRLWIDDRSPLAWMAPLGASGVSVHDWDEAAAQASPGDVVIEAFGCDPPPAVVARMAQRDPPPLWINLEYLSAEAYVERSHGLPSPQLDGAGRGLTKWFYYPGFTAETGGLLREPGLLAQRARFDRDAWLADQGWARRPGERVVLVFCYDNPALPRLLHTLVEAPTLLLLARGPAQQAAALPARAGQRRIALPPLSQADFDRALWSADICFVRGEDSPVRAIWGGAPFVWQIYAQGDRAHVRKLDAFLARCAAAAGAISPAVSALWQAWNGLAPWSDDASARALADPDHGWRDACRHWRAHLAAQDDLATRLLRFVDAKVRMAGFARGGPAR